MLSIKDYEDSQLVSQCLMNGCYYYIDITLLIDTSNGNKTLILDVEYKGDGLLKE